MNSVLEQILATDTVKTPAGESLPLHSHIEANGGAFLQNVITQVKPKVSLEIGLAYGRRCSFVMRWRPYRRLTISSLIHFKQSPGTGWVSTIYGRRISAR